MSLFKIVKTHGSLCSYEDWFKSYLVGNSEDMISCTTNTPIGPHSFYDDDGLVTKTF